MDSHVTSHSKGLDHDDITKQINIAIDRTGDYLAAELNVITDHI